MTSHSEMISNQDSLNGSQPVESKPGLFKKFAKGFGTRMDVFGGSGRVGVGLGAAVKAAIYGTAAVAAPSAVVGTVCLMVVSAAVCFAGKSLHQHIDNRDLKRENKALKSAMETIQSLKMGGMS